MFKKQQPKYIVQFQIDFNLSEVKDWIKEGGDIQKLGKNEPHWYGEMDEEIKNPFLNSYVIDIIPNSLGLDCYYHSKVGRITNNIGGVDYLENTTQEITDFCERNGIRKFVWGLWRQYITVKVNNKLALVVPLDKIIELQIKGKLSRANFIHETLDNYGLRLDVPISFDDKGVAKETISVWHSTVSTESVGYFNEIVSISASTLNFKVEY